MKPITIRVFLTAPKTVGPGDDNDLEIRLFRESKIRQLANTASLGDNFIGVEFIQSQLNAAGNEKADFHFRPPADDALRDAEVEECRIAVRQFMKSIKGPTS